MSLAARQALVIHPHLFFSPSVVDPEKIKGDLLRDGQPGVEYSGTQTTLIALLQELLDKGHIVELTIAQTGHHDDGICGHAGGDAVDCWPLASARAGDWLDSSDPRFKQFLYDIGKSQYARQTGLVGDGADSSDNFHYASKGYQERGVYVAGVSTFQDGGGSHVHAGAVAP